MLAMLAMLASGGQKGVEGGRHSGWAPGREGVCGRAWARTRCAGLPGLGRKERGNSGVANRRPLWKLSFLLLVSSYSRTSGTLPGRR